MNINFKKKKSSLNTQILVTAGLLTLARVGNFIPLPYIDRETFLRIINSNNLNSNSLINILNTFSGGASTSFGLLSVGILPSINASIIMQVLSITTPSLEKLKKEEGEYGRRKLTDYTRYLTLLCAIIQSVSIAYNLRSMVFNWNFWVGFEISICLTTGSMIILWLSELITRKGVGNGSSLLICANIVSSLPDQLKTLTTALKGRSLAISFFTWNNFLFYYIFLCHNK